MALQPIPPKAENGHATSAPSGVPLHGREGRVNGSLGATRGRVNGSQVSPHRGYTNGRSSVAGAARRRGARTPITRKLAAVALALAMLVPAVLILAAPQPPAHFAADGDFREWAAATAVADTDAEAPGSSSVDLTEVRTAFDSRILFVYAKADGPWFGGDQESVVRIFVDADGNRSSGFDLGDVGADIMLEAAGAHGGMLAKGLFAFSPARDRDDWHGWLRSGSPALAVRGNQLEAGFGRGALPSAAAVVAVSTPGRDDILDLPASPAGALVVGQSLPPLSVVAEGAQAVGLVSLEFGAVGRTQSLNQLTIRSTGSANFTAVDGARLTVGAVAGVAPSERSDEAFVFRFDPPQVIVAGTSVHAALEVDFKSGKEFDGSAGASFGGSVESASSPSQTLTVIRPRELPPAAYLGFVSPTPVIDGAFGEWRLSSAAADPIDAGVLAGSDLVGVQAMASGFSGAFYAEARGAVLSGSTMHDLPLIVDLPASGEPGAVAAQQGPPEPQQEPPPLSTDDRVLVYLDADSNPQTGFRPAPDVPVGAEFVVQVAGRFSTTSSAQFLRFAGSSRYDSAWQPARDVKSYAFGNSLEGEIPAEAFAQHGGARVLIQTVDWTGRTGDLSDGLQDVATSPADPDHLLHFRSVTFDPLTGPAPVRPALLTEVANGYWVVQLQAEPDDAVLGSLEAAGATLFGYVHSNAYLARMDESVAETVRSMSAVRWVGIYEPAFKFPVDPASWGDGPMDLVALLFENSRGLQDAVETVGGQLLSSSAFAMRVRINGSQASALGFLPEVQYVEPEHQRVPLNDVGRAFQGVNLTLERHGYNGSGIVVGISDSGLDFTHPGFDDTGNATSGPHFDGRIVGYFRYGGAFGDSDGHGTHTAGSIVGDGDLSESVNNSGAAAAGQFRGMAPAAMLVVSEIFDGGTPGDEGVFADQQGYGATASSNSWGYIDGQNNPITDYDASAYLTDQSVIDANTSRSGLQPMTIVFAAGNDGSGANTVSSPSTAKNVIVVGASETDRGFDDWSDDPSEIAVFSSRGPTDDGRIRPDVVAVGTFVLSTQSRTGGCTCTFGGWDLSWTGPNYAFLGGTSQATPQVAGIAALLQQHFNATYGRIPSPALVKAALINGAEDLGYGYEFTGGVTGPMSQGWGRVNVTRSIDGPPGGTILHYEEGPVVSKGDVVVRRVVSANASVPLKVTLVWSDQPGNPQDSTSLAELVNDLDLVVRAPNGTFHHGNKFQGAWSRANNSSFDRANNVENVFVQSPGTGTWTVEVAGFSLKSAEQKFALVISGNVSAKAPPSVADAHGLPGAPANAKFGWNVTASGSINGDSFKDLIVGAPGSGGGNGSVYIFFGGAGKNLSLLNVSGADVTLSGAATESFGSSVDASGDFDGDGKNDLLVGAPGGGKAYLFLGGASWTSRTANVTLNGTAAGLFGSAVRLAPIDNRTGADALIGAPLVSNSPGAVYIFSGGGAAGQWNASAANGTLTGAANGSRFGTSLSAGDIDGDGYLDMAVGAPGASVVNLTRGGIGASALAFNANFSGIPGSAFGQSVALGGDVNGDGKADLVVGAPLANDSAGAAYVFFGRSPLSDDRVLRYYFFDDMESGVSLWDEMSGSTVTNGPWSLSSSVYFGPAISGHSWQDSSGNYAASADASIATKAGLNLSLATSPVLSFVYRADLEDQATNFDGFLVKYSLNGGSTWTQLNANNSESNYDTVGYDPPGGPGSNTPITDLYAFTYDRFVWRSVTFNLTSLVGNSSVKFRFQFGSDSAVAADGLYIDDIAVREARPASPNFTVYGEASGDLFGWSVAGMGDANGDGEAEFAVGAPKASSGLTALSGAAYVFTGSPTLNGSISALEAAETLRGPEASANLGWALTPITGFNGSTATFLFAGAPGTTGGSGGALIGDASAPIPEFENLAAAVAAVAAAALVGNVRGRRRQRL